MEAQKPAIRADFGRSPVAEDALNPNALTVPQVVRLLKRAGSAAVTEEMIRADLAAGAPANPDGTINLVHYAAWLVKEMAGGD
jgi:hypothetical protein